MTRDEVLDGYTGGGWDEPDVDGMADEIVRLRERIAAVEAELDAADRDRAVAFDELAHVEQERSELREILLSQEQELGRVQRILAALRNPSEAVKIAVQEAAERETYAPCYYRAAEQIIRAAVAAAEDEVSHGARATKEVGNERA